MENTGKRDFNVFGFPMALSGKEFVNGEVVLGEPEYDGRVILYILKGVNAAALWHIRSSDKANEITKICH